MIWFLLVKMIGKTRRAVITVGFFRLGRSERINYEQFFNSIHF